jgi:hypothetical protein
MFDVLVALLKTLMATCRSRQCLLLENLALRHQIYVLKRKNRHPNLKTPDRLLWTGIKNLLPDWRRSLLIVRPETVVCHRQTAVTFLQVMNWLWVLYPLHPQSTANLLMHFPDISRNHLALVLSPGRLPHSRKLFGYGHHSLPPSFRQTSQDTHSTR